MLGRKLVRTAWRYRAQFLSMILMLAIGVGIFLGFHIEWYSLERGTSEFFAATNYPDFRLVSEAGFTREDAERVAAIDGVDAAGRFLSVDVELAGSDAKLALMVSEDAAVSQPYCVEGAPYDPAAEGFWLSDAFARCHGLRVGDTLTLDYPGVTLSGTILGLCKSGEMLVCTPDKNQIMPDFSAYGFAFASPAFLEAALGGSYYPQLHLRSAMDKPALETAAAHALGRTMMLIPKKDHLAYASAQSEIDEGKTMAAILPLLFLAIGVLTMVTTMHRIAANEKVQIGTLKALGFRDRRILAHYTAYGLAIGLVGAGLGVALGYAVARAILSPDGMMGTYFDLPVWELAMPGFCVPVIVLTVVFLTLISFLSVKQMLRGTAADALRPYQPKAMRRLAIERLRLWERLPFGTRWNLRDVLRHKVRSAMTLLGVMGCMLLLVGGLGMKDSLDWFLRELDEGCVYATRLNLSESADPAEAKALAASLEADWGAATGISYGGETVALEIYDLSHDQLRFFDEAGRAVPLADDGAYLCLRLADTAKVGDVIEFSPYGSDETYRVRVAGFVRSVMTKNILLSAACADELGLNYLVDSIYTDGRAVPATDLVASRQSQSALMETYNSFMGLLDVMVWMLVLGAVSLGVVVLYNLGLMSYLERGRELATLKVLGFRDRQIGRLLVSQNIWLTVLGVVIGLPAGVGVLQWLIVALGEDYELKLVLGPLTYVVSIALTFGVSLAVGWMVARKNRKINMVEALKDAE